MEQKLSQVDLGAIQQYSKLKGHLKEEQRLLKILEHQADEVRLQELLPILSKVTFGRILLLKNSDRQLLNALVVEKLSGSGQSPYFLCLRQDNYWAVVGSRDVTALGGQLSIPVPSPPKDWSLKPGHTRPGNDETATIAQQLPQPNWTPTPEVLAQQQRIDTVQIQIEQHPAHVTRKEHSLFLRLERRIDRLQSQLHDRKEKLHRQSHQRWNDFLCLVNLLRQFEALDEPDPDYSW
ncbi:MAG: hypothetical protein HC852_24370 [Acaryochloridaceae cyanobacterium RU_4_10]|nr:hypothetical protein [Acaryochloridaceae cyanobacterium RU_4_10]